MKYDVIINGKSEKVDVVKSGSTITLERNGVKKTFSHQRTSSGFILESEGKIFHTNIQTRQDEKYVVNVNEKSLGLEWKNPYRIRSGNADASSQKEIKAVMPGRVVKILVSKGQEVQPGQSVLVLEAMKMENEIKSARAGVIASILVKEGDSVESGGALIHID